MPGNSRSVEFIVFALSLALAIIPTSTLGAKDQPRDSAQGLSDWEHDFDISKLAPGEYNIVVQGKDVAGNAAIAGPINVYVDPKSDLPIVSVINPSPLLRVGGDLNIVGTCADDDAVARVEVSLDGGEFQAAQGTDFWSLYVNTKDMSDGRKTIAVRGVDVNGVVGPVVKVSYDLDRSMPLAQVGSPAQGALVAGSVAVSGSVFDANGIASLESSIDGGKTFAKLGLKRGKDPTHASFSLPVDTRKFPDGPRVIWLRSVDSVGSKGRAAFLIFVDNTKPTIEIARPLQKSSVHGKFTVAGAVRDSIGIAKLSYELGKDNRGEIPITPGNPYFAKEFDSRPIKGDRADVSFIAVDKIGNTTRYALSLKIDRAADKPVLRLASPKAQGVVRPGEALWGSIADDDGGAFVRLAVDGGKETEFPASDVFAFPLPALSSGRHVLSLKAVDAAGVLGDAVSLPVSVDLGPGSVSFLRISGAKGGTSAQYLPGAEFRVDSGLFLEGAYSGGNPPAQAEYSVGGGSPRKLDLAKAGDSYSFRIALDRSMPYGFAPIELRVKDALGETTFGKALLYSTNLGVAREAAGFDFDDPRVGESGHVAVTADEPFLGAFYGDELDSLRLEPATALVAASFEGREIAIKAATSGETPPTTLIGRTKRGHEFKAGPFVFASQAEPAAPQGPLFSSIVIGSGKAANPWSPGMDLVCGSGLSLSGAVVGPAAVSSLVYRVNGGAPQSASLAKPGKAPGPQAFSCPLPPQAPGRVVIDLSAKDSSGNEATRRYVLHSIMPQAQGSLAPDDVEALRFFDARIEERAQGTEGKSLVVLKDGEKLVGRWNGRTLASVSLEPATSLASLSMDGNAVTLEAKAAGYAESSTYSIKAVTVDGDVSSWGPFSLAVSGEAPEIRLDTPLDYSWNRGSLRLSGLAEDPTGIASLGVSLNGGEATPVPMAKATSSSAAGKATPYPFDIELPLAGIDDGAVKVELVARSAIGRETRVVRFINKDTAAPSFGQILPAASEAVNGTTTFVASASDAGHVAKIEFIPAKGSAPEAVTGLSTFSHTIDLSRVSFPLPEGSGFVATDLAGNSAVYAPAVSVDSAKDKPIVDIQAPEEFEVLRADFSISGAVYDDDGVAALYYRLDGGEWKKIDAANASFSIPMSFAESADNEHLVEIYAEDIYGVRGETAARKYRISKEEPTALMKAPPLDKPSRGLVEISGTASDANGIASVRLSFDNVSSYELAVGAETWRYTLDTRILKDGLHPIAVKPLDKYDTEGFYASILNVDNTPPVAELSLPEDGAPCAGSLAVSGRVYDNIKLAGARIEIAPVGKDKPPAMSIELSSARVVRKSLDISALAPGDYTVRLVARDSADNESLASRDIHVLAAKPEDKVELLFPVDGDSACGKLKVSGRAMIAGGASAVTVLVDGSDAGSAPVSALGYFSFDLPPERLSDGRHAISARAASGDGQPVESRAAQISWKAQGPWLSIDSLPAGAYLPYRPLLSGSAGWSLPAPDPKDKVAMEAYRKAAPSRRVLSVALSLDNGKSYLEAQGTERWRFRLETQDYAEGGIHLIARAKFGDGSIVVTKTIFSLDKTPPEVKIVEPEENGRFNGSIHSVGTASDASGLASVDLSIRKGDKRGYELPGFIQGLYIDTHVLGATYYDVGLGLSFFQDNVKLQVMAGQAPEDARFGGEIVGAKLLANIAYLPASYLFGPDWDFLSASFALGANFSYFSKTSSGSGLVLGAVVAQLEFPKVTVKKWSFMKKYSFYTEGQAWFVSSDVQGGIEYRMSCGLRFGLF